MEKPMFLRKFRIRTLGEGVTRHTVFLVKWFIHSNESVRIGFYILPVPSADFVEHLVDKPHVKGAVQIKYPTKLRKRRHEQVLHEVLQFRYRRLIRQRGIQSENQHPSVNSVCVPVFLSAVVGSIRKPGNIGLCCFLPDGIRSGAIPVSQPLPDFSAVLQFFKFHFPIILFHSDAGNSGFSAHLS